jgi:hypothetical protein
MREVDQNDTSKEHVNKINEEYSDPYVSNNIKFLIIL